MFQNWWNLRSVRKFRKDRLAVFSLFIIGGYAAIFLWTSMVNLDPYYVNKTDPAKLSWIQKYNVPEGEMWEKPSSKHWLGTDRLGRDIFRRLLIGINTAFKIGLVTALLCCLIGLILGGLAGFFGGWVDLVITWLFSVFSSIPTILLLLLISAIFRESEGAFRVYVAFCATYWIGPCRVVRGEIFKIKEQEYVQAATVLGNNRLTILFRHVMPNTLHLVFVYFSLIFIGAIKSEVILTFLNLGVKGMPSWGLMIEAASKEVLAGFWWQMIGASLALFVLVYAFNIFTDALQDALDPKHVK